ncbi:hypothetical protein [Thermogemmata fonticola]|jgi:hypothetical protein|nr:hypothetical protein [Thermogemmata fonticola]
MRLRDLVELDIHKLQGELAERYQEIASWSEVEGLKRGCPATVRILPLRDEQPPPANNTTKSSTSPDAPVAKEEVLVTRCRLDVIALVWASLRSGVWEITSRLWSRPVPPENSDGVPFAPGEPFPGLALLEQLLVGGSKKPSVSELKLDDLAKLFSPNPEAWRALLDEQDLASQLRRDLDGESPALLVAEQSQAAESRRWIGLPTRLSQQARLIGWIENLATTVE